VHTLSLGPDGNAVSKGAFLGGARSPVPHEMICEEATCSPWPGLGTFPESLNLPQS
jgi:hypothetical protein